MKKIILTFIFTIGFNSSLNAEETATAAVTPTTPKQVCDALAKAAAADNFQAFQEWTAMPGMMCDGEKECKSKDCPMHKKGKGKGKGMAMGECKGGDKHSMHGMNFEKKFHEMHAKEMEKLKGLNCKDEKIAGDHAWVEVSSQDNEIRLVPFRLVDGKWKFDMHAYRAFYHQGMMK